MADEKQQKTERREPSGFTPRSGGLTSEYAREQGWDIAEEQRAKRPPEKQEYDGGTDYEYGAQDFGDTAVDTSSAQLPEPAEKMLEKLRGTSSSQTPPDSDHHP